ncbi:MAG: peptidoglycan bridge formation glycyltransferase FemA/FemB family protein [Spirochaetaceae bacterium]|nr:peptidoglycan bridge formation glycyltransferase FemA/FemB family protein [Spirochaetaceae bacterium]
MPINIEEIECGELSNNNPFVSKYWAIIKSKNNWNPQAFIIYIDEFRYELLFLTKKIKSNYYLSYVPFAPLPIDSSPIYIILENLEEISIILSKKIPKNVFAIKFDLPFDYSNEMRPFILSKAFKNNKNSVQPTNTIYLNLDKGLDYILKNYRKRAKRNLNKNLNNVEVKIWENTGNTDELKAWYDIYRETGIKDGFSTRPYDYVFEILKCDNTKLILAIVDKKIVGGNIVMFGKSISVYLLGGSLKDCGYSVSYTLQDYSIKLSIKMNIKYYDLFGVGGKNSKHLKKLNLFKSSFGGTLINRVSTFDFVIHPFIYRLYKVAASLRYLFYRG